MGIIADPRRCILAALTLGVDRDRFISLAFSRWFLPVAGATPQSASALRSELDA